MDAFKISIKLFTAGPTPPLPSFIPVFHQWIRDKAIPNHLLIDVADYAHVQNGPGIVLVSSEANIYIDENDGRPGLLYVRKLPAPGTFADRLRSAISTTLIAAGKLESEPALVGLKFDTGGLQVKLNDRLLAPNDAETLAATSPAFEAIAQKLYPDQPIEIRSVGTPRDVFTIKMLAPTTPMLAQLSASIS